MFEKKVAAKIATAMNKDVIVYGSEKYFISKLSVINCQIMNDMLLVYSSILEIVIMLLQKSFVFCFSG